MDTPWRKILGYGPLYWSLPSVYCFSQLHEATNFLQPYTRRKVSITRLKTAHIKPADKGGAVVVWKRDLYVQEANRQLSDNRFYQRLDADPIQQDQKIVKDTIKAMIASSELPPTAKHLVVTTPRTSCFYLLPKIHKPNNPGRPIVSACCCPTENISAYLAEVMAPIVKQIPTYVKDTNHALIISIFDSFAFDKSDQRPCFLFTMDVKSLYAVIPDGGGPRALTYFLDQRTVNHHHTPWLAWQSWYWDSMPFPSMTNTSVKLVVLPWVVEWGRITRVCLSDKSKNRSAPKTLALYPNYTSATSMTS